MPDTRGDGDTRREPLFPQLPFVNKPIFWNSIGAFLIGIGGAGIVTRAVSMELSVAAFIVGGFCLLAPIGGRRLSVPSGISWLIMPVTAALLLIFFYFAGPH